VLRIDLRKVHDVVFAPLKQVHRRISISVLRV
jgi:hypothetical protein